MSDEFLYWKMKKMGQCHSFRQESLMLEKSTCFLINWTGLKQHTGKLALEKTVGSRQKETRA